jgi:putative (di)nucleoside polyphosphate hydrolase
MSGRCHEAELSLQDLIADPIVRLIMKADGIDERELRELLEQAAAKMKAHSQNIPTSTEGPARSDSSTAFRRGVGIMLLNSAGHVFVGQRNDIAGEAWQMPQGGIEPGEEPQSAAFRELREELGTTNVEIMASTDNWFSYELPPQLLDRMPNARWKGQTQKWFLMRFLGKDDEINIATEHPEFSQWRWAPPDRLIELIVPFKRDIYRSVLSAFADRLRI